jgi:signal transduction histidine kinase
MSKIKLLVVEDEPNLLLGIRDILELDQYQVFTARDGRQALQTLQMFNGDPPDLIVSDIMMPHMNGIEFLKEVRKNPAWVTIPFIFLTAKGEKHDIHEAKKLGVDDYVIKPFDAEDLLIAVSSRLQRKSDWQDAQDTAVGDLKGKILTILNHEFRTPLTLVVAYADMLKEHDVESMSEQELLLFLREINSGADRMRRLVENFILLVELETGEAQKTFEWRKYKIADMDQLIRVAYHQIMDREQVRHTCELQIDEPLPSVEGDRDFLVVMVRELLDNAVKFSPVEQPITLRASGEDGALCIEIRDKGRGIASADLEHIWNSFYQINREEFEDQGAGSGLALVKGLADLHGATVQANSSPEQGSVFTLRLPIVN